MVKKALKRPNILIIYTDQQRWDSLRCYGNEAAYTPNLDRLAEEGVLFEHHYVQNPVCMPSRMSMLSGCYPGFLGIGANGIPLPVEQQMVHNILKPYGYHTANIGKLHFVPHVNRRHQDMHPDYGFDTMIVSDEPGCYDDAYSKWVLDKDAQMLAKVRTALPPAAFGYAHPQYSDMPRETHEPYIFEGDKAFTHSAFVAQEICDFLERNRGRRFFAIAGFYAPHTPVNPPSAYLDKIDIDKIKIPVPGPGEQWEDRLKDIPQSRWKKVIAYYLALVSHVDDCIGTMLKKLDALELREDTIVIFTSDHGEYLGDHGRIQKGPSGHDQVIRVPLIIRYPGKIEGKKKISNLVESVDIVPTILDFCSIQQPVSMQGMSLRKLMTSKTRFHKEEIMVDMFNPAGLRGTTIRTADYKYYTDTDGNEILYDLKKDPEEFFNIVNKEEYKSVVLDMQHRMIKKLQQVCFRKINQTAEY